MRSKLFLVLICAVFLFLPKMATAENTLKVGMIYQSTPFAFLENGKVVGFNVDIKNAICSIMKVKCEIVRIDAFSMKTFAKMLNDNSVDFVVSSTTVTEKRKKIVDFTDKYYSSSTSYLARKSLNAKTYKDLYGKTIGVVENTVGEDITRKLLGEYSTIKEYTKHETMLEELTNGRIDAIAEDTTILWNMAIKDKDLKLLKEPAEAREDIAIIVKKGNDSLREKINKALHTIIEDKTYENINKKYFPFSIY